MIGAGLALVAAPAASAATVTTYYVTATGNDNGTGTKQRPWRSIRKAVSAAPAGAIISVAPGTYTPFVVTKTGQTVVGQSPTGVVVKGAAGVQDVVRVAARNVSLLSFTVAGCVPNPAPDLDYDVSGSSGVRISDGASNALVRGLTVRDSHGVNTQGQPIGCFGIIVRNADASKILGNDIYGNGSGIYFSGGGRYAEVTQNKIHDNDVVIRNTSGGNDDFGASAVAFTNMSAAPGPVVTGNTISRNSGPSLDYDRDGGAFEIYNASNLRIAKNTLTDNENVLETGTSQGGACLNNVFTGNTSTGRPPGGVQWSKGVILRCATNMQITGNSFLEVDWWVFVIEVGDVFSSGVQGLTITDNTISQWQKVYHLGVDPVANAMVVDRNRIHFTGPIFASYGPDAQGLAQTDSASLADWRARSGLDQNSVEY